jgi:hypothetical protein
MNPLIQTFKILYNYAKEEPRDFVLSIAFMILMIFIVWASLWGHAIISGTV